MTLPVLSTCQKHFKSVGSIDSRDRISLVPMRLWLHFRALIEDSTDCWKTRSTAGPITSCVETSSGIFLGQHQSAWRAPSYLDFLSLGGWYRSSIQACVYLSAQKGNLSSWVQAQGEGTCQPQRNRFDPRLTVNGEESKWKVLIPTLQNLFHQLELSWIWCLPIDSKKRASQ